MGIESITAFDAAAFVIILISGIIALARGFTRELATISAFVLASTGAFFAHGQLRETVAEMMPENAPLWLPDLLIALVVFLGIYIIVAMIGRRVAKGIHAVNGLSFVDRTLGLLFGALRGAMAVVFFVFILSVSAVEEDRLPDVITQSATYPHFKAASDYLRENAAQLQENSEAPLSTSIE